MDEELPSNLLMDAALWRNAVHDVNAWRGACLQQFSAAEAAVTETLLLLSLVEQGSEVRLRHLIGQRFEDLARLLDDGGVFAGEGKAAAQALAGFRTMEGFRTALAHGQAKVALDRAGNWIVVLRHVSIRAKQAERAALFLEQDEAKEALADLKSKSCKLCSVLGNFRKARALTMSGPVNVKPHS